MKGVASLLSGLLLTTVLATAASAAPTGKLVLYTSQPERDAAQTVAAFNKAHPGVTVDVFRSGTTELMAKLAAEFSAGQPQPDVLLIADAASVEALKADGRLQPHPDADVSGFDSGTYDSDRTYFGSKLITTGIVFNTAAPGAPSRWADLADPEMKGMLAMPSPLYSGAAAIMLATLTDREDLGWRYYEALRANDALAVRGNGAVLNAVAGGERMYGVLVDFMAFNAKAKGSPVEFVFPAEGVPAVTEPVAILGTARNPEAARAFVDFILSADGQELAAAMGYMPARAGSRMPDWLPEGTQVEVMRADIMKAVRDNADNLKRFESLFAN